MKYSFTTPRDGMASHLKTLLRKEIRAAMRFYPIILAMVTLNACIAVGAPIVGTRLASAVDVLGLMILMSTYTMMGFSVSSFAEDKQDGMLELMVTCPVSKLEILMAKIGLGLFLAVPFAMLPYGLSAFFLLRVSGPAVLGLAAASFCASLTATSVALLLVVSIRRIEVGVYLGFMAAMLICFTPAILLRVPVLRYLLPGYYSRQLFEAFGDYSVPVILRSIAALAVFSVVCLLIAARRVEREDAVLTV